MKSFVLALAACGDNGTLPPRRVVSTRTDGRRSGIVPDGVFVCAASLDEIGNVNGAPIEGTKLVYIGGAPADFGYIGLVELP